MKKVWKKACSLALTVAVLSSYSLTANALGEETKKYETEKYLIEKVSNPTSGEGEVDGILTGQDHWKGFLRRQGFEKHNNIKLTH